MKGASINQKRDIAVIIYSRKRGKQAREQGWCREKEAQTTSDNARQRGVRPSLMRSSASITQLGPGNEQFSVCTMASAFLHAAEENDYTSISCKHKFWGPHGDDMTSSPSITIRSRAKIHVAGKWTARNTNANCEEVSVLYASIDGVFCLTQALDRVQSATWHSLQQQHWLQATTWETGYLRIAGTSMTCESCLLHYDHLSLCCQLMKAREAMNAVTADVLLLAKTNSAGTCKQRCNVTPDGTLCRCRPWTDNCNVQLRSPRQEFEATSFESHRSWRTQRESWCRISWMLRLWKDTKAEQAQRMNFKFVWLSSHHVPEDNICLISNYKHRKATDSTSTEHLSKWDHILALRHKDWRHSSLIIT